MKKKTLKYVSNYARGVGGVSLSLYPKVLPFVRLCLPTDGANPVTSAYDLCPKMTTARFTTIVYAYIIIILRVTYNTRNNSWNPPKALNKMAARYN